ncbi:hypothetical protein ACFLZ4_01655 [Patescibacteria group bacterium]
MSSKKDLNNIIRFVLNDTSTYYGGYGRGTLIFKRVLWWKRLKIAYNLYEKNQRNIGKKNLVDFGCQFGFLSALLSHSFSKVYLVDINQKYLNLGIHIHNNLGNHNYETVINSTSNPSELVLS